MVASTSQIRSRFPALSRRHAGQPVAYFDGPGGTQVPGEVADAVREYLVRHNANAGWAFPTSAETDAVVEEARGAAADLLGAGPREVVFGANMTTLTFHLARVLGREMEPGDEVVVTALDHHANVAPWRDLEEQGVEVRTVPFRPETGRLRWDAFEEAVGPRTRLVAVGLASNALGTVNDVGRAAEVAGEVGARLFVDAVHAAPHLPLDVEELGCDFLACSAYKFYGPHAGILYGRRELLEAIPAPAFEPAPDSAPGRLETGTPNFEAMAGTAAAVEFLASLADREGSRRERLEAALEGVEERGKRQVRLLWQGLSAVEGVRLFGPPPDDGPRTPTVSFAVAGLRPREVASRLADRGVFVSHGDFYAPSVLRTLDMEEGLVRAGCACYTTRGEVRRLVRAVESAAGTPVS